MSALEALLEVQSLDTALDQLRHRRVHLPARAELEDVQAQLRALDGRTAEVQAQRDELARTERRLEDEIATVRGKAEHADKTLYGGTVSATKELLALQEEIASLQRRQRDLEDQELEVMEQAEPIDAALASLAAARGALDERAVALVAAIAEAEVEIDGQIAQVSDQRATAVAPVPDDLVAEYERKRKALGGVGVARLTGSRCEGCHLTLPAMEVDRIRHLPPDEVVHCSECDRILVR